MKASEIIELIKQSKPKLLGDITDEKAAKIVSAAFSQLNKQLTEATDGKVVVPSLGIFKVKQVERQKDGQAVKSKKVSFRASKLKAKGTKAKGGKKAKAQEAN
ncbi:hypothetical protein [Methylocucumis oryzae]|uniref:DNA-binding protein n=1 Tax=Methylocucumis oryzae TaxID=1632867 RepID=A0A0F3IEY1_9GAMM|nr:hypothetical protein [Methylocucumis oryzae]KJV05311.1 hypothetical protein VZ94_19095 [Methylocucumis oryzae]